MCDIIRHNPTSTLHVKQGVIRTSQEPVCAVEILSECESIYGSFGQ